MVVAIGKLTPLHSDILFCADGFAKTGVNPYRKIFDLTRIVNAPSPADIRMVRNQHGGPCSRPAVRPHRHRCSVERTIAELARIFEETSAANIVVVISVTFNCRRGNGWTR